MWEQSFEELCREHMDQHMLEAEKLSNDAGMAHRVHEWQMKLEPKLQEEVHLFPSPHPFLLCWFLTSNCRLCVISGGAKAFRHR